MGGVGVGGLDTGWKGGRWGRVHAGGKGCGEGRGSPLGGKG